MANKTIKADELGVEINTQLKNYSSKIQDGLNNLTDKTAKKVRLELKRRSPKRTGRYAKSWTITETENTFSTYRKTVHNKRHYRLTHLLEDGHKTKNGKMTRRQRHIAPVVEEIGKEFVDGVKKIIKNSK